MRKSIATISQIINELLILLALTVTVCFVLNVKVKAEDRYLIEFLNEDDSVISSQYYDYGDTIYIPDDPYKETDETYEYRFEGWGDAVHPICTKSKTYKAEFSKEYVTYNARIVDYYGNCIDNYYCRQWGYYGDTLDSFADSVAGYLKSDAFMSDDIKNTSSYSSILWKDFCLAVKKGDYSYNPQKQYECIGFTSLLDGTFYKISDFYGKVITKDEDFRITFAEKEDVNPSECDVHYYYITDYDIDDPIRMLDYDEIDTSKEILSRHSKVRESVQMPLEIPYPEEITDSMGRTYYLNKNKLRYYSDQYNSGEYDVWTEYSNYWNVCHDEYNCYVLPVYEEYASHFSLKQMDFQWERYDEDGKYVGYSYANAFVGLFFDVPEGPGFTRYNDNGFQYRIFTGKYKIVTGNNRTIDYVNAGESVRVKDYWCDFNGGSAFLVEDIEFEEIMYDVRFEDYDGATFKQYHSRLYRKVYVPDDPVRDDDENYTYEFEGWRNKETGELVESIDDRIRGSVTYVASYKATKVLKSSFSVSIPAIISLTQGTTSFSGSGVINVSINTNDESFYVDVVPDTSLNLTGFYQGEELFVVIDQEKTRFKPDGEGESEDSASVYLESAYLPEKADIYEGFYSYEIRSGYDT